MVEGYQHYSPDLQLHTDDIEGIQYIYGKYKTADESLNDRYMLHTQHSHCFQILQIWYCMT